MALSEDRLLAVAGKLAWDGPSTAFLQLARELHISIDVPGAFHWKYRSKVSRNISERTRQKSIADALVGVIPSAFASSAAFGLAVKLRSRARKSALWPALGMSACRSSW